jgi:hypothetical protein
VAASGEWHGQHVARRRRHGAHCGRWSEELSLLVLGLARSETNWPVLGNVMRSRLCLPANGELETRYRGVVAASASRSAMNNRVGIFFF